MGIFNELRRELVDIVEWIDDTRHTLVYRFPRYKNELKNGAQLIVRPGQTAVFVREGKIADVFEPGTHELVTSNLPILSRIEGWKYGFNSPFKAEVYFVSTRTITDLAWGTPNPVLMRDADFGSVRLRAFGNYTLKTLDPRALLKELVGTDGVVEADEVTELLRSVIVTSFSDVIGQAKIPALDLAAKYSELAELVRTRVCERIDDEYGLQVPSLQIVNIALPEAVEKAIDSRGQMAAIGDMQRYQQFQLGNALGQAGQHPGGGAASDGLGMGLGFAMAQQAMRGLAAQPEPGPATGMAPPPAPGQSRALWHVSVNGQTLGPVSHEQLVSSIKSSQLDAQSYVWRAGMSGWLRATEVPELAGHFAPPPPPPPMGGGR